MPKRASPVESIRKRIQKWEEQDPSSLVTERIEKATTPLQWLVALLLPTQLIQEAASHALWGAEAPMDREEVLQRFSAEELSQLHGKTLVECDAAADMIHAWAIGTASQLSAWDAAGPLGIAPSLASLFALVFRTIRKIGFCYGYDTSTPAEEQIVLEVFMAGGSLLAKDRMAALSAIRKLRERQENGASRGVAVTREHVLATIAKLSRPISASLTRRRTLAGLPALDPVVGTSTNAWLLQDVGWAARNVYAMRRLEAEPARGASAA